MLATFFSYFIIFFIFARCVSLSAKINWMPTLKTTHKHDVIISIIFSLIIVVVTFNG